MTEITQEQINRLVDLAADRLIDQCTVFNEQALLEAAAQLSLPVEVLKDRRVDEGLDQLVFWCDRCGWCCSTDELHNEGDDDHCEDCDD